jgi:hypothetical protein
MPSKVSVRIDTSNWSDAVKTFHEFSSRPVPDILNRSAGFVALKAFRLTDRADKKRMKDELYDTRPGKRKRKGKTIEVRRYSSMAYFIVRKKTRFKGEALRKATAAMVGSRMRSVGFIAIGWLPAAIELLGKMYKGDVKLRGRMPVGHGTKATPGDLCVATLEHLIPRAAKYGNAVWALKQGIKEETASLQEQIKKRAINLALRRVKQKA